LEDRPRYIKAEVFPYCPVDVEKHLAVLANPKLPLRPEKSFICRYSVDGRKYIQIIDFLKHQRPHHTEKDSILPPPHGGITVKSPLPHGEHPEGREGKGKEGKGGEGKEEDILSDKPDLAPPVVEYLNQVLGTKYSPRTKTTKALVRARQNEGRTLDDFKTVIDKKVAQWKDDPKMAEFLRPETLFGSKFESYLNTPTKKDWRK